MPLLDISDRSVGDVTVLALKGRLIFGDGDRRLRDRVDDLVAHGHRKIILDLSGVTYIDSAGLGMLVAKYLTVHREGGDIKLLHPTPRCDELMRITHLRDVFEVFGNEDAAVESFTAET